MKISQFLLLLLLIIYPIEVIAAVTISVTPTSDKALPGGVRSVYSNVQGDANVSVIWSTSGGTLIDSVGYTTWTAPDTPGTYTVTATSVADPTKTATTTFTVVAATVRVSNIPAQATIYKGQSLIIQSILWGSTNTSVTWSSSGGTLTGTGREVVFTASVAGTYTVTATSVADLTKTATTTIVVTNNVWSGVSTSNKTLPIDCTHTGSGTAYDVTSETEMDTVPWATLGPGDTVRIHPGVYHKQILISTSGTDSQPIRICGVRDGAGNLPELNGANATAKAGSLYGTGANDLQIYAGIMIYNYGSAYYGGANYPKNIIIEGLKITGYNQSNTFTDLYSGLVTNYNKAAAAVRVQRGGNITIRGNDISSCGNGLFTMSKDGTEAHITRNLLVEGNYFHENGVSGDYLEHQNYLQTFGLVVQGNYYDFPTVGATGGQLKSRSVQQFVRYNYFKPALRMLDLVEEQDDTGLVFPWVGYDASEQVNTSASDIVANLEAYQNQFVYGNILHNEGSPATAWMVHGAADTSSQDYNPGGTLYFYHNTIYSSIASNQNYRSGIFDFGPYQTAIGVHTVWPKARVTNNAIFLNSAVAPAPSTFFWNRYKSDRVVLDKNWISTIWGTGNTAGGDGTGIANANGDLLAGMWQGGQLATQVSGTSNLIAGSTIPFNLTTYAPTQGSPLVGVSVSLPGLAAALPPLMEYSSTGYLMTPRAAATDLGAIAYTGIDTTPPTTTASPAGGTYTSTQSVTLSCTDTSGCEGVYFTVNGDTPVYPASGTTTQYTVPIAVSSSRTVKWIARDALGNQTAVQSAAYTINSGPSVPSTIQASFKCKIQ